MKKKLIIVSLLGILSIFLVAGTITLASTTDQSRVEPKESNSYGHEHYNNKDHYMNKNGVQCDGTKKGYHKENRDCYNDLKNEDKSSKKSTDSPNSQCNNEHNMKKHGHQDGNNRHMRMGNSN